MARVVQGLPSATGARRERISAKKRHGLPIVAINRSGAIAKANASAKKVLTGTDESLEGANLGALLVGLVAHRRGLGRRTSLSFHNAAGEREDVLLVLSESLQTASTERLERTGPRKAGSRADGKSVDFIAHELRNPLGTILGLAEILETRAELLSAEDSRVAIETIHAEADRALLILNSILKLAEATSKSAVNTVNVPLHAVVRRVIDAHKRRFPHRTVSLSGDSPLYARANSVWVELALTNLINNAEKYSPQDRMIEIAFHENGSRATILVLDNGNSLQPEAYRGIWDTYYRGAGPDVVIGGSGIGLALCKELVERMGGQVWAGPRKTGGSVFAISLPSPWEAAIPEPLATRISALPLQLDVRALEAWRSSQAV